MSALVRRFAALGVAVALALAATPATPQTGSGCPGYTAPLQRIAFEQVTVGAAAVGFTEATYSVTRTITPAMAVAKLETAQIRYRDDATDPTAAVGTPADPGDVLVVCGASIASFRAIRTTGTSGVLNVHYYKVR